MSEATRTEVGSEGGSTSTHRSADLVLAGLLAAAGVIHVAMVPQHASASTIDGIGFAAAGWFQLGVAALLVARRASRALYVATAVGNVALLALYLVSRTVGLPIGGHEGIVEDVGAIDGLAALLEVAAVALALYLVAAPEPRPSRALGPAPVLAGLAVLALATAAIVSPDAASHGDSASGGHAHGTGGGHEHGTGPDVVAAADEMALVDEARCDLAFNPQGYWDEAAALGVDTYTAGQMTDDHHTAASSLPDELARSSVNGGRGSKTLDELIVLTERAGEGEAAAGRLVAELSEVSDEDYREWLEWLRASGALSHGGDHHGSGADAASPDDTGHGGHVGPQPWKAMVDQRECDALAEELAVAREVALAHPTAADATKAGWVRVTPYVPGIAAHYMNFSLVDGTFELDKPEMLLYDGNGPDARIVGLSYYVVHDAESEPTQGFTGDNDHYHRHIGLCVGVGGVIGDSTTTDEECAAMGGRKQGGGAGWMNHVWVVPGCESPWGVFSAASPLLDRALAEASGQNEGGCVASGVADRWDLSPGGRGGSSAGTGGAREEAEGS